MPSKATRDETRLILNVRRSAIFVVVFLGYGYYRFAGDGSGLASIGLLSFAAIAQLAPPFLAGLYWKRANARGAIAGLIAGIVGWGYVRCCAGAPARPASPADLSADIAFADPLLVGCLVSLSANIVGVVLGSLSRKATPLERIQAAVFCRPATAARPPGNGACAPASPSPS